MDFDKWMPQKREIENLDSCYMNFEVKPSAAWRGCATKDANAPHRLIDWTSAANQTSVDYANPTYSFFAFLVFKFRWMRFQAAIRKFDHQLTSNGL